MRKGCIAPICLGRNTTLALFLPLPLVDYESCGNHGSFHCQMMSKWRSAFHTPSSSTVEVT